jgi:uncharacterized protein YbjT (DUF2867 family)
MILVCGSTGNIGREVVRALTGRQAEFRAAVRGADEAKRLNDTGVNAVVMDFADPQSLDRALAGVDCLFLLTPAVPNQARLEAALVDAAERAGVRRIVKQSLLGAQDPSGGPFNAAHAQSEARLRDSSIVHCVVRPNSFMQNLKAFNAPSIAAGATFYGNQGEGRVSLVDTRDIGDVYAELLLSDGATGICEITGSEAVSNSEVAERLTSILGRPVAYVDVGDDGARSSMSAAGMPDWTVEALVALGRFYRNGSGAKITDSVHRIFGRAPRTLDAYLRENASAFAPR